MSLKESIRLALLQKESGGDLDHQSGLRAQATKSSACLSAVPCMHDVSLSVTSLHSASLKILPVQNNNFVYS